MKPRPARLVVLSSVPFHRGYGTLRHLIRALHDAGLDVRSFAPIPADQLVELAGLPCPVDSYYTHWYGGIPRVRNLIFRLGTVLPELVTADAVVCGHLGFFPECVLAKWARPRLPLIHYCPELWTREEYGETPLLRFYSHFAHVPDLIIDANLHRAKERQRLQKLATTPSVLPNTLPIAEVPPPAAPGELAHLAGLDEDSRPWLVHAGNLSWLGSVDHLMGALAMAQKPFRLVIFANGSDEMLNYSRKQIEKFGVAHRVRLLPGRPWKEVMGLMSQADAGLVYYPESAEPTVNVRYCAPTKAYDYLALGLPVVSTANASMRELLTHNGLGVCAEDDSPEALARAIDMVFSATGLCSRTDRQAHFREELCFEVAAAPVLREIRNLLSSTHGR